MQSVYKNGPRERVSAFKINVTFNMCALIYHLSPVVLNQEANFVLQEHSIKFVIFIQWVEVRDAAEHPSMHRAASLTMNHLVQSASNK